MVSTFFASGAWRFTAPKLLADISAREEPLKEKSDEELHTASLSLQYRARSGEKLLKLLPEAFALVREAARRTVEMRHFDVQLLGGMALARKAIAEMETGEGKTLTATLPLYLYALAGKGAHLATVNDYLARRDAEWMKPIYELLGLSVGVVLSDDSPQQRRRAYACDITYGTAKEFGFDFLRDRLARRGAGESLSRSLLAGAAQQSQTVRRGAFFVLVDEADSILIDEARTPLIIGIVDEGKRKRLEAGFQWGAKLADQFAEDEHFDYDHEKKTVELTVGGRSLVRAQRQPAELASVGMSELYRIVERAVRVHRDFHRDQQYVVRDGEIVIVDEFTGRLGEGRKWRDGVHQAVEAKEGVEITMPTGHAARITIQDLFLLYRHVAGMTGTARPSAREFRKVYKRPVIRIPTNKPVRRQPLDNCVFATADEKWEAVVKETLALCAERPVLIGTRSIDKSEELSRQLSEAGIEHQVLNARHLAAEAEIVAQAGQAGKVTVATNMAGRGTDIKLDNGVAQEGGLHVICTELHDSARIDRQLSGRCGRQGDPGTYRQYLALDDDILEGGFGPEKARRLKVRNVGSAAAISRLFRRAQHRVERAHLRSRMMLLYHEKQRKEVMREMGHDPYLDTAE